jgi:hypothetical protein
MLALNEEELMSGVKDCCLLDGVDDIYVGWNIKLMELSLLWPASLPASG